MNEQNNAGPLSYGADLIKAERLRQVHEEGWDEKNDDGNSCQEMLMAAEVYMDAASLRIANDKYGVDATPAIELLRSKWPYRWDKKWFKPTTSIRDLVKAGALIAAEIDRLKRLEQKDA